MFPDFLEDRGPGFATLPPDPHIFYAYAHNCTREFYLRLTLRESRQWQFVETTLQPRRAVLLCRRRTHDCKQPALNGLLSCFVACISCTQVQVGLYVSLALYLHIARAYHYLPDFMPFTQR